MKKIILWLPIVALLFLSACGEEIARLPINKVSVGNKTVEKNATLNLTEGEEILIWSEMDMQYEGDADMYFLLTLSLNDEVIDQLKLDPRDKNVTVGEVKTNINGKVNWKFSGKMGHFEVPESGDYNFSAIFVADDNVYIDKAEMVIKK